VYWSENGELCCITTDESFFVLKYNAEAVEKARDSREVGEDGIEEAFDVIGEIEETVKTGVWVGDCFIYTNSVNRLNYYVGGEIVTIAHLDRLMYLLGYIPKDNRLYLGDKELNIVSFSLLVSVLEYQTAVMRRDFETADKILPMIPREHRSRVAHFLEKQGFKSQALAVTCDHEHKFELAIQLGDLKTCYQIAKEAESEQKWKQLAELAISKCEFGLAQECLHQANDFGGLLLLASAAGNAQMVAKLGDTAEKAGQNNVAFISHFVLGRLEECLEVLINTGRLPEAAFFARTYLPSQVSRVVELWREHLGKVNKKAASSLADPQEYENLFPDWKNAIKTESYLKPQRQRAIPADKFPHVPPNHEKTPVEEMKQAEEQGSFTFVQGPEDGEEEFEQAPETLQQKEPTPPQKCEAPPPEPTPSKIEMDDLEKELELDLENMNIDNVDPSDINLDEDLLED
jgi:coatomer subunit beta'